MIVILYCGVDIGEEHGMAWIGVIWDALTDWY